MTIILFLLFIIYYLLFNVHYQLLDIYHLPLTIQCFITFMLDECDVFSYLSTQNMIFSVRLDLVLLLPTLLNTKSQLLDN